MFVVASKLAEGKIIPLAIPAMCSLYQGLNARANHPIGLGEVHYPWPVGFKLLYLVPGRWALHSSFALEARNGKFASKSSSDHLLSLERYLLY